MAAGTWASEADAGWQESQLLKEGLRRSDIALMPEGTPKDYRLFASLRPTAVAWGEEGLPALDGGERAREMLADKSAAYRKLGVRLLATNVWMLTATERHMHRHPEMLNAVCVDLWGERILPRWLSDAEFEGVKPWWGCTNNPLFQEHLLARMRAGLEAGATMVHLDDHSGTFACATFAGGCFCEYCMRGFREWLEQRDPAAGLGGLATPGMLVGAGADYRAFLLKRGYADRKAFITAAAIGMVPLWERFLQFQRDAAIGFVERMKTEAAGTAGRAVAFGVNSYDLLPVQLFDAHTIDYFANEVEQFDKEDIVPPVVYRLGEALGRPVFATGTGEDWIKYRQAASVNRVRGWIAEAYAFGQYFMYSWNKWGFSEETGTLWTEVDPEVFRPAFDFVSGNPELFDGFENAAAVGLLYDNASAAAGHWGVRDASRALLDAGVPYRLVVSGDGLLRRTLTRADLDRCRVLVVPGDVELGDETDRVLANWVKSGGAIIRSTENDKELRSLPGRIEVTGAGRVWALPRVQPNGAVMAVHILNRDYDAGTDAMIAKTGLRLSFKPSTLGGPAKVRSVRYCEPGANPCELEFKQDDSGVLRFEVPRLDIWGIVLLSP